MYCCKVDANSVPHRWHGDYLCFAVGSVRQRTSRFTSLADFVTDHAADSRAADGSDGAAARKNGASYGTDAGADGGILVLRRHSGTTTEAEQNGCGECAERKSLNRFHGLPSLSTMVLRGGHAWSTTARDLPKHVFARSR